MVLVTVAIDTPDDPRATVKSSLWQEAVSRLELAGFKIVDIRDGDEKREQ